MASTALHPTRSALLTALALVMLAGTAGAAAFARNGYLRAGGQNTHNLYVGMHDNWLTVRGDGRSDLDCWVYDEDGSFVDSDVDETDYCILKTPGIGQHRLVVKNQGSRPNSYALAQRASLR